MRILAAVLAAAHLAFIAWTALRPLSVTWVYGTNVTPLATIQRQLMADPMTGIRTITSSLLLLAPLGVLLPMLLGRITVSTVGSLVSTAFVAGALSFAIECAQTFVPGQVFDVDTMLLNTAGVALAHLAVVPGVRARLRRRGARPPKPGPPGARRSGAARVRTTATSASYRIPAHRGG